MTSVQKPPFLLTYWNPFDKKDPGVGQSFLNYVKDVSLANYTGNLVGTYIENASQQQIKVLQKGFTFLDQRMARVQQEQINTNILLENIGELLKLPDSEKQRQLHIERGLKFSNQSRIDEDISIDAKNELDGALALMPQDWFVLQQLGMLLLFNEKVVDIAQAREYFIKAAKYANADSQTEGIIYINSLFKHNLGIPFESSDDTPTGLKDFVREAFLSAALSSYILGEFEDALNLSKKALALDQTNPKSLFLTAKYLARNNKSDEAVEYLEKAVTNGPYLCLATYGDGDLGAIPQAVEFCNKFSTGFFEKIELLKNRIGEIHEFVNNSEVLQFCEEISNNDIVKCCEFLEYPLIAENYYKDPLFSEAAKHLFKLKNRTQPNSLYNFTLSYTDLFSLEGLRDDDNKVHRSEKIATQLENAGILIRKMIERSERHFFISVSESELNLFLEDKNKLDNYIVSDLAKKWNEIKIKCEDENEKNNERGILKAKISAIEVTEINNDTTSCFIATATLGNINHPILFDLRYFRDNWLSKRNWGKSFTKWYYKNGPRMAKFIAQSSIIRSIVLWIVIKPLHFVAKRLK